MNPIFLQKQLRENASDLQDFCKELKNWGEEMKRKEETLKNSDTKRLSESPSDNKKLKKSGVRNSEKGSTPKKTTTKVGATDYAAWDKFDADAECDKLEDDINDDSELTDECNDNMQDLAIIEKEKGNKFVKSQKWDEAIKCYSKAIEYYSYDPIFFANRALCYLKNSNFEEAEKDCTLSLKLDNTYVKAYQRRAAAREGLNKLELAEYDLSRVLELEPKNKESKESLEKLRTKLGKSEKIENQRPVSKFTASRNKTNTTKTFVTNSTDYSKIGTQDCVSKKVFDTSIPIAEWPEEDNIIFVKPVKKPPHMRSKKPLKRITIVEKDGSGVQSKIAVDTEPEAIKQHVFEKQGRIESIPDVSAFKKERIVENKVELQTASEFKNNKSAVSERLEHATAWPKADQQSFSIKSNDFNVIEKQPPNNKLSVISKESKNSSNINLSSSIEKTEKDDEPKDFVKPKTSVQFNLTWKNLKTTEQKYKYLKAVEPQDIPKIFLNSLESHVFSDILEILAKHFIENKDPVFNILNYFTQVNRFGTFTMFLSSSDKKNLWILFDYIKEIEQKNKEDVDKLIEKYEL